ITAALSVYNSCVYCNSRMLFGLAQQGNAPRALLVGITAALSVYNSCVYCNSRMLFGLAQQGNAPRALL
ncbi:hypothetical protein CQA88_32195, partial [Klebsiella pneumoniae]